jgi:hypothetical protein
MTQEEKRIKLYEAAGWEVIELTLCNAKLDKNGDPEIEPIAPLPDCFTDLNAVHELFKCIPQNLKPKYFTILCSQVSSLIALNGYYEATEVTAAQRCEAIGKTLDLW